MARLLRKSIVCIVYVWKISLHANALTYSLKVRRAANMGTSAYHEKPRSLTYITTLPIIYDRKRHIVTEPQEFPPPASGFTPKVDRHEDGFIVGSIFNVLFLSEDHWWLDFTTGLEYERLTAQGKPADRYHRTGIDDLVFTGGYNAPLGKSGDSQVAFYIFGGVPTRTKITAHDVTDTLVGTRYFAAGFGGEISGALINNPEQGLIIAFQSRFLHFFSHQYTPIFHDAARTMPGSVVDLLGATQYRRNKYIFEAGYNPVFTVGSGFKVGKDRFAGKNYLRNSIYVNLARMFGNLESDKRMFVFGFGYNFSWSVVNKIRIHDGWIGSTVIF